MKVYLLRFGNSIDEEIPQVYASEAKATAERDAILESEKKRWGIDRPWDRIWAAVEEVEVIE